MGSKFLSVAGSIASIALIVVAARWLFCAKGPSLPRNLNGTSVYAIKWQWRAVGFAGAVFWVVVSVWSWHDLHSRPDGVLIAITVAFVTSGFWLSSGSVSTNRACITKTVLWSSRSLQWGDITEIATDWGVFLSDPARRARCLGSLTYLWASPTLRPSYLRLHHTSRFSADGYHCYWVNGKGITGSRSSDGR
jgi:hypothetical protein